MSVNRHRTSGNLLQQCDFSWLKDTQTRESVKSEVYPSAMRYAPRNPYCRLRLIGDEKHPLADKKNINKNFSCSGIGYVRRDPGPPSAPLHHLTAPVKSRLRAKGGCQGCASTTGRLRHPGEAAKIDNSEAAAGRGKLGPTLACRVGASGAARASGPGGSGKVLLKNRWMV
jgi:hypothetical protein